MTHNTSLLGTAESTKLDHVMTEHAVTAVRALTSLALLASKQRWNLYYYCELVWYVIVGVRLKAELLRFWFLPRAGIILGIPFVFGHVYGFSWHDPRPRNTVESLLLSLTKTSKSIIVISQIKLYSLVIVKNEATANSEGRFYREESAKKLPSYLDDTYTYTYSITHRQHIHIRSTYTYSIYAGSLGFYPYLTWKAKLSPANGTFTYRLIMY